MSDVSEVFTDEWAEGYEYHQLQLVMHIIKKFRPTPRLTEGWRQEDSDVLVATLEQHEEFDGLTDLLILYERRLNFAEHHTNQVLKKIAESAGVRIDVLVTTCPNCDSDNMSALIAPLRAAVFALMLYGDPESEEVKQYVKQLTDNALNLLAALWLRWCDFCPSADVKNEENMEIDTKGVRFHQVVWVPNVVIQAAPKICNTEKKEWLEKLCKQMQPKNKPLPTSKKTSEKKRTASQADLPTIASATQHNPNLKNSSNFPNPA